MTTQTLRWREGTARRRAAAMPSGTKTAISIVGSGQMGTALARALSGKGTRLFLTSRVRRSAAQLARQVQGAVAGPLEWVVANGDVVILATPVEATCEEIAPRIRGLVKDKVLIDVSNPGLMEGRERPEMSAAERIAQAMPAGHVVKALNCVAAKRLGELGSGHERLTIPVAGDDMWAKACVADLVQRIGFDTADAGALSSSRWIEGLSWLLLQIENSTDADATVGLPLVRVPAAETAAVQGGTS
ncbi:NAD(P)-binding domain-containing protein [Nonomuraea sp. NPDC049152]|uniref:NADPH-dependent F420 reductase n=1 Tax=Nonomuraea sp. NPDC049152 TaxID=3154350 RepID=UPI0033C97AF7